MSIAIKCWVDEILFQFMQLDFKDCQLEPLPATYIARATAKPLPLVYKVYPQKTRAFSYISNDVVQVK